ncbi:MAG: helix-turn-helix transcriptional regulator [Lachnospiraceae bacterium]|nr:helix-turn-helix transcriptional regulator [Lachnospiraceae bacterium]
MLNNVTEIGIKIRQFREAANLTQQQIAEYLSVDQSLISKFEKGERAISSDTLNQLAVLFCCPVSALVSAEKTAPTYNIAFRTNAINFEDLNALSVINKIALNQLQMDQLAGGIKND